MATPHNFPWLFLLHVFPCIAFSKSYGNWNQISLHLSGFQKPTKNALNNKHIWTTYVQLSSDCRNTSTFPSLYLFPFLYLFPTRVADSLKGNNWQSIAHSWPKFAAKEGERERDRKQGRKRQQSVRKRERAIKGAWKNADCHVHT